MFSRKVSKVAKTIRVRNNTAPHIRLTLPLRKIRAISLTSKNACNFPQRSSWSEPGRYDPVKAQRASPFVTKEQISKTLTHKYAIYIYVITSGGAVVFYIQHLETTPVSGRRRFMFFTDADAEEEGMLIYRNLMQTWRHAILPPWDRRTRQVKRVMERLIVASGLEYMDWEVNVIFSHEPNAFVLPGGKVFVMSGILSIAETDAGLASVLSHEIAHTLASHQAERMSSAIMIIWPLRIAFFLFFDIWTGGILGNLLLEFGLNRPASRTQEREADYIGLMMMAKACYDPRAALVFWKRMEQLEAAQGIEKYPWLSTHPSTSSRADLIQKWIPIADAIKSKANCHKISRYSDRFMFNEYFG